MRTPAQQAASRANGARSRGLLARATVPPNESRAGFDEMLAKHIRRLSPRDGVQECAVEEMCSAAWRLLRLWSAERKALELEVASQEIPDQLERILNAFDSAARNRPHFLLLHRYETRLHNIIQRTHARLLALRQSGAPIEPGEVVEITTNRPPSPHPPNTRRSPPEAA